MVVIEKFQKFWWQAALPLTRRIARLPAGIWLVWACLAYAGQSFAGKLGVFARLHETHRIQILEALFTWAIIIVAVVALARRRLIARMFIGMAMTLLLFHAIFHWDVFGIIVALIPFPCLFANRRWFYERLPNVW